jgi:hypothetical protein
MEIANSPHFAPSSDRILDRPGHPLSASFLDRNQVTPLPHNQGQNKRAMKLEKLNKVYAKLEIVATSILVLWCCWKAMGQ